MKRTATSIAAVLAAGMGFAAKVEVSSLPEAALPNSEVTTNIALDVNWERLETLSLSVGIDACGSNFASVAVGTAAGDALALEEVDFEWGFDCGAWFAADVESGEVEREYASASGWTERTVSIGKREFNPAWNMVRLTKRGVGSFETSFSQAGTNKTFKLILR